MGAEREDIGLIAGQKKPSLPAPADAAAHDSVRRGHGAANVRNFARPCNMASCHAIPRAMSQDLGWLSEIVSGDDAILDLPEIDIAIPLREAYANSGLS
jgi:hypothetical protein